MKGQHTYTEIRTQPAAWMDALAAFDALVPEIKRGWQTANPGQVIFTGCGSTHYLSQTAASLFQSLTHIPARAFPASEIVLFDSEIIVDPVHTLLVAISRSGTTTETLQAMERFRRRNGRFVWNITCYPDSPMAQASDLVLPAQAAQEKSVAQTRSFASMLILAQALAAVIGGKDTALLSSLPDLGDKLIAETDDLMQTLGGRSDLARFYFLGSGFQYGVAHETMLKMTEMSLSHSQAFHFMEFRHGPMSMADEQAIIIGLLSCLTHIHEQKVLAEMGVLGAHTLALTPATAVPTTTWHINLEPNLPAWAMPVLYLPPLQLLAYYRALHKGLDPDNPRNLEAVVYLDTAVFNVNNQ